MEQMVSTFTEITGESHAYAVQHLGSCRWNLEEALNSYFTGAAPITSEEMKEDDYSIGDGGNIGDDDVRAPMPAHVELLYGDDAYVPAVPVQATGWGEEEEPGYGATGWGEEEPGYGATGWGEAEPGYGGQVIVEENVAGHQVHDNAQEGNINGENNIGDDDGSKSSRTEEEDNEQQSDDNMSYSDNEIDDYGLEVDEDSYYTSIEDEDATEPPTMQRQEQDSLEELYRPPLDLMCNGTFHSAKVRAASEDKFLLVNLQTRGGAGEFQSLLHNRDLWSDDKVKGVVKESFVFLLLQKWNDHTHDDDWGHMECSKVCSFYRLADEHQLPAVLVLDPITGQLLAKWSGPMTPDEFVKYVDEYRKTKPSTMLCMPKFVKETAASAIEGGKQEPAPASVDAAVEQEPAAPEISAPAAEEAGEKAPEIVPDSSAPADASCSEEEHVPAPEMVEEDDEPMEGEKMYKLRIRLPDGTMVAKEFGCKRRVASLFAFCRSAMQEQKAFRLMSFTRGAFQAVQGDGGATFEDLDLNLTTVSVVFDA